MARRVIQDEFFRKAKREGYVARSAYKLAEIDDKRGILAKGFRVLDLGCAPGSWIQVAAERIGPRGTLVGVDLKQCEVKVPCKGETFVADAFKLDPEDLVDRAGGRFHVVLSDMAPSTTGAAGGTDHARSVQLCRKVLELATGVLRENGSLVMKVLEGEAYPSLLQETGLHFRHVKGLSPRASRDVSTEIFVIAKGFRSGGANEAPRRQSHVAPRAPDPVSGWGADSDRKDGA